MPIINDFYDDEKRAKKRTEKDNKEYEKERDVNFVKLLEDQQILHLADCNAKYASHLIKTYKKEELNYSLVDDIEEIWENQTLDKDVRYRIVIIRIFNPDLFQAQRRELLQGNIPESSVGLNEKSRYIIETLITTALELPYRIWPYWKNINEMTLSTHFDYWEQKFAEGNDEHFFRGAGSITNKPLQSHILKTAEELGAKPVAKKKKYWVELKHEISYPDDEGQKEPAKNAPYTITFPDGQREKGTLDSQGKARHDNLKIPGRCTVKYEPTLDDEIKQLQDKIKKELDKLVEAERKETQKIQKEYDESNWAEKRFKDAKAVGSGVFNFFATIFGTLWDIYQSIGNTLYGVSTKANMYVLAPYHAPEIFKKDVKALKEKYEAFRQFTDEDLEVYFLFIKDEKTSEIFLQFGEDYLEAQHYSEYIEGGAEAVFGVILTILTAGAGGVAAAGAAGARLASTAGKIAPMVKSLAKLLKRKRVKKDHSGDTNTRLESKNELKRPNQVHHYATNKNKKYSPKLQKIANKYDLNLDEIWNKELLPHQGRHPNAYHEFVIDNMKRAHEVAKGDKSKFLKLFNEYVKEPVRKNPDLLRKKGWE